MYRTSVIGVFFAFLEIQVLAQTKACPACDSLRSRWNPHANTGSCLVSITDPVQYIVAFEQCLCSPGSQSDYAACAKCNLNGDGGVPIDGLNFGAASRFSSACSVFGKDVTSVLQPSGLNAFAIVVAPIVTTSTPAQIASADVLGYYALQNVVSASQAITGIETDSVAPRPTGSFYRPISATPSAIFTAVSSSDRSRRTTIMSVVISVAFVVTAVVTAVL